MQGKDTENKIIKVAILAEEPLGWGSGKHYFPVILDGYTWTSKDKTYKFSVNYIFDKDIFEGKLNITNYDVLLVPGGGVGDGQAFVKGFLRFKRVNLWKEKIAKFIKEGGGYVGICGGTALITDLNTDSDKGSSTFTEQQYKKSSIGVSCVTSYYKDLAIPVVYPYQKKYPERIGAMGYVFSFAPGETADGKRIHAAGVPIDFQIIKDNPIFSDFPNETERIRWWGGPALIIPDKPDREVKILARYPKIELSENEKTRIYAWKYIGGPIGLIKAFFKSLNMAKKEKSGLKKIIPNAYFLAGNWMRTEKVIELNFSNKPSMTTEIYPNENHGRIILTTAHPEYMIWHGGHIEEVDDNGFNSMAKGFHQWKNISPLSKTFADELTHTWWIVRRMTAWAAKIPDDHMPQISKDELNEKSKKIISKNIIWDGSIWDQIENI
ncbi:hypothetical protein AYK24_04795 [Thermoplasmatales archaeon SG8-52-4]|nr:MAG: hypothetical protein AYK24_04795 [Thermoplasmatales archaeon SG8-52-4]